MSRPRVGSRRCVRASSLVRVVVAAIAAGVLGVPAVTFAGPDTSAVAERRAPRERAVAKRRAPRERAVAKRRAPRERAVATGDTDDDAPRLTAPQDIESRIFFSDRPPSRGSRERAGAELLERMLKEREVLVVERRKAAIAQLRVFIKSQPSSSPHMADALLRLAELTWEKARAAYLDRYAAWQQLPEKNRSAQPPAPDLREPMALYARILEQHSDFDRYDLVLYMRAYALVEAGHMSEALSDYRRIIDDFPDSRFRPDAHMAFAEWYFTGSFDYAAALPEYEQVMKYPQSELADLALFKSAWCLWKLDRITEAATRFREVLDLSGRLSGVSGERRRRLLELQDEALEYLIQVFTEDERNTAADLHAFLSKIGGEKYASRVLRRLSRTFFDQARYDRAIEAYRMLLAREPGSSQAPDHQRQIAMAYSSLDDAEHTIEALEALAANYGPQSAWAAKQADPDAVARASRSAERAVRTQAMRYHERAQRDSQTADFESAVRLYRVHGQHFASSPFHYEVTFYRAEILFHRLKQYDEAGRAYLAAARAQPQGKFTQDALYNAIIAFEKVRVAELEACTEGSAAAGVKAPPSGVDSAAAQPAATASPCQETETDRRFSEAIALYIELYPNDPEVPGILFRQGRMYFERGIYDPAVRQFGQLLEHYPRSEFAAAAGELVLESFNRAKDYKNIETWARKLKDAPAFQNAQAQRKLDTLILQSVFKLGEQLAERKEHAEAARAYQRAAAEFPRDPRAPKAFYNAGREWRAAGNLDEAADAYGALIEQHPGSEEGALGAWAAAQMFESIAQFGDAAHYYEAYARQFPRGDKRADALYNAVVLRLAAGDYEEAAENGVLFGRTFPNHDAADEVRFMVGRAHESAQQWAAAASVYRSYVRKGKDPDLKVEAQTRLAKVLLRKGDRRAAQGALRAAVKAGKRGGARLKGGRYFAAEARFIEGDLVLDEFERIRIEGEMRSLGKRLSSKSELLKKAAAIYGDVVEFRVAEWVTAALFKIGHTYELFAEALRAAPIPENLSEAEEQAYRDQLAMFIVPIEERALEAYEGGYQKALELRVFNRWTQKLREGLTRLNDVEYPPLREMGAEIASDRVLPLPAAYEGLRRSTQGETSPTGQEPAPAKQRKKRSPRRGKKRASTARGGRG